MTTNESLHPVSLDELDQQYQILLDGNSLEWHNQRVFSRCLGVGGQGVVYLSAREGADGFQIPVALKLFSPKRYADSAAYQSEMARLSQVAAQVARVQENHLVAVQNFVTRNQVYIPSLEKYQQQCLYQRGSAAATEAGNRCGDPARMPGSAGGVAS